MFYYVLLSFLDKTTRVCYIILVFFVIVNFTSSGKAGEVCAVTEEAWEARR